ncbi:hypothetical protein HDV00_008564 [Rhizophlyctis rosea]|nr:hypothetical protein HDV00_008564 [Rhizophlyctis rosea]
MGEFGEYAIEYDPLVPRMDEGTTGTKNLNGAPELDFFDDLLADHDPSRKRKVLGMGDDADVFTNMSALGEDQFDFRPTDDQHDLGDLLQPHPQLGQEDQNNAGAAPQAPARKRRRMRRIVVDTEAKEKKERELVTKLFTEPPFRKFANA